MAGLSRSRFDHAFLERTGFSPGRYYTRLRIAVACHLLREGECSVRLVSERVGYGDPLYFARLFRRETGCTPSAYQREAFLP
jgi:AraC-like DNA-binding protein